MQEYGKEDFKSKDILANGVQSIKNKKLGKDGRVILEVESD